MDLNQLIESGFLNLGLLEEKYDLYKKNPAAVEDSWRTLFSQLDAAPETKPAQKTTPSVATDSSTPLLSPEETTGHSVVYHPVVSIKTSGDSRICSLVEAYRTYGHLYANTNPLSTQPLPEPYQLRLESLGFSKQDLSLKFPSCNLLKEENAPLLEIINALKSIYCGKIGFEYMGLLNEELEGWIQGQIETNHFNPELSIEQKTMILQQLNKSELFESFLHTKYVGQKRFSLEGAETLIPMLASMIDTGASTGIEQFVFGMAHRGRLNVLCNIFDKSYGDIFSEFEEGYVPASIEGSGDVKYHKGFYSEVKSVHGHQVKLTLTPNPSHLEAVDPVVEGQVRARQDIIGGDKRQDKVLPVLIHGDAAIAGQGVVYETMQFCRLDGYATGGSIHFVINNQIGFTTLPKDARSTHYCTDIAHAFGAPVFHVNAEDPEACVYATNLAVQIRQKFHCDVFIELSCYRKYGHNEGDEPAFTQPLEYQIIRKKRPIRELYRDALINQGVVEKHMAEALEAEFKQSLQEAQNLKRTNTGKKKEAENNDAASKNDILFQPFDTSVDKKILQEVGERICTVPEGFVLHPKVAALVKERLSMVKEGEGSRPMDWGMAENLAYGSLLWQGTPIRISGQDCCRGTFSHRHALFVDQVKEQDYIPLQHLKKGQGHFEIYNSSLSEYGVLGFEYGYSVANPKALVIWEAQFGDFCNSAQVTIDQFIASAEQKWGQKLRLTLFLPHGYEGQGPEHSSARIERFLTLAGDNNMQIVNPTTPAQLFHLLRRQVLRPILKPLVVFTPKGLLRFPTCVSTLDELSKGSFQEILEDLTASKRPKRLILCSGRFYYDLYAEREKLGIEDMMIVRIEQLYPLNIESLKAIIGKCTGLKECIWVQEEPSNMGAWTYIRPILRELLPKQIELNYVGRTRSASPATGSHAVHKKEHQAIINALFGTKETSYVDAASHFKA